MMNTDNTQGGSEPSLASAGCQPVAWAVFEADGHCVGTYAKQEHARIVMEELACDGMVYEPLYRSPTLTCEEREVLLAIEADASYRAMQRTQRVVRGLLERMG